MATFRNFFIQHPKLYAKELNPIGYGLSNILNLLDQATKKGSKTTIGCNQTEELRTIIANEFHMSCGNPHDASELMSLLVQNLFFPKQNAPELALKELKHRVYLVTMYLNSPIKTENQVDVEGQETYVRQMKRITTLPEGLRYGVYGDRQQPADYLVITLRRALPEVDKGLDPVYIPVQLNVSDYPFFGKHAAIECQYQLHAVIVHGGMTTGGGHVWAYVQEPDGQWYECNDSVITPIQINDISVKQAIEGSSDGRTGLLFVYRKIPIRQQDFETWLTNEAKIQDRWHKDKKLSPHAQDGSKKTDGKGQSEPVDPLENALQGLTNALQNLAKTLTERS